MVKTLFQSSCPTAETTIYPLRLRELVIVTLGLLLLCIVALRPSIRGNDGVGHYVYLASMLRGGDIDFADEYAAYDALKQYEFKFGELPVNETTGRASNRYGPGASLLWAPFVIPVHLWMSASTPERADALDGPYATAVGIGTAFWACLGLLLLYARLRRECSPLVCAAVLASLVLATPLGFYMLAHGSMGHGVEFFAVTVLVLAAERWWRTPLSLRWLAAVAGCAALVAEIRAQAITWSVVVGVMVLLRARGLTPRPRLATWLRSMAVFIASWVIVFFPQLLAWKILNGSFFSGPTSYLDGTAGAFLPFPRFAVEALFFEHGGVLSWHPIFAVGLFYCWRNRKQTQSSWQVIALLGLFGFLAQWLLVASWSCWWAGASFGNRFFIGTLPALSWGIALWLRGHCPRQRMLRLCILGLLILWNMGLLVQYATEMVPREDPIPWTQVIRQNVTDVPVYIFERLTGRLP